eukprot:GEMP01053927.1.p1 GENE.GEMP01053927.1~~GEMP01053927.1.p1  ORF type:complete len:111 (-),score=8.30 GEMP01053927.1:1080-1412(-)
MPPPTTFAQMRNSCFRRTPGSRTVLKHHRQPRTWLADTEYFQYDIECSKSTKGEQLFISWESVSNLKKWRDIRCRDGSAARGHLSHEVIWIRTTRVFWHDFFAKFKFLEY